MPKMPDGVCRLCGDYKELSFEHIPPKKAFNNEPKLFQTIQDLTQGRDYTKFRRGVGDYALCERCNNTTGGWYGEEFVNWSRQGMEWLGTLGDKTLLHIPFRIRPLNVIKQVMVMALAMTPEQAVPRQEELRQFVLNKEQKYLPTKDKVYVYFNREGQPRFASVSAVLNIYDGTAAFIRAEVSLPPFGYCVCSDIPNKKSMAKARGLYDITWFSEFDYNIWAEVFLRPPILETRGVFPLNYGEENEAT